MCTWIVPEAGSLKFIEIQFKILKTYFSLTWIILKLFNILKIYKISI
jgi:hypothetical protein